MAVLAVAGPSTMPTVAPAAKGTGPPNQPVSPAFNASRAAAVPIRGYRSAFTGLARLPLAYCRSPLAPQLADIPSGLRTPSSRSYIAA